jgi:hypothetical protein
MSSKASTHSDRTRRYTGGVKPTVTAGVTTGLETASMRVGQVAILSAVNMPAGASKDRTQCS